MGASLDKLGYSESTTVSTVKAYHAFAFLKESAKGGDRYTRVGPINEPNHTKAIRQGYKLFK